MLTASCLDLILNRIPSLRLAVVGDLFLDRYFDVDARLTEPSLETGLPAYQVTRVRNCAGAAGLHPPDRSHGCASAIFLDLLALLGKPPHRRILGGIPKNVVSATSSILLGLEPVLANAKIDYERNG